MKSLFLALVVSVVCWNLNVVCAKELHNEVTWATVSRSGVVGNPSCQHDADYDSVLGVNGTSAGSWPSSLVEDKFPAPLSVRGSSHGGDVTPGRYWFNGTQRKARESDGGPIRGAQVFNDQGMNRSAYRAYGLADSQVEAGIQNAIAESVPPATKSYGVSLPSIIRNVDRHDTWSRASGADDLQVRNHVRSGEKVSFVINKEPSSVYQLHSELIVLVKLPAQYWDDGRFDLVDGQNESLGATAPVGSGKGKAKKDNPKKANTANDSHTHGVLTLANDGKAIGCDTAKPSSSTISISCPQIDSVGLHQEALQSTTHDR